MRLVCISTILALSFCGTAAAAPALIGFSGTVAQPAGSTKTYHVLLYQGSSADLSFNTQRKLLATTETDVQGHFVLLAGNLPTDQPLTIRAKNAALNLGGDAVLNAPANGAWPQVTSGVTITPVPQSDPNFGIRNNNYGRMMMYFVTDRQAVGADFGNTAAENEVPSAGTFMAHVALGNGQAIPGKCGIAPDWRCNGPPVLNDDGFIDQVATTGTGSSAHNVIRAAVTHARGNAILLFVHGYNNSFDQGAEKAARLSYLMGPLPHATIMYSWPSEQQVLGYPQDTKSSDLSAKANLGWVLDELVSAPQHPRVILAAHSMGSYALTTALDLWALQHPTSRDVFSDLVLFAGDLDVDLWKHYQPEIARVVKRIKFYTNSNDQALHLSTCTTGDNRQRVGQITSWSSPVVGFDATRYASTNGYGHGYLVESTSVALDWNRWMRLPGTDVSAGIRRLPWLNDGGGSLLNGGKITSAAVCSVFSHIHF